MKEPTSVVIYTGGWTRPLSEPRPTGHPTIPRLNNDAGSQYTSVAFTGRLLAEGIDPSVGSVGDALDNALAETTVGSFKNELIRRQGPWRDVNHVEIATAEWVLWFNTERPHEYLDDFTPEAVEKLHYDHRRTPPKAG